MTSVVQAVLWVLRQRRYTVISAVMLVVALGCVGAGTFELHRYHEKRHDNGVLRTNAHSATVPLTTSLVPLTGQGSAPGALAIVPHINRLLDLDWARIDASQDWHPPNHRSFLGQADQSNLGEIFQQAANEIRAIEPPADLADDWSTFAAGVEEIAAISNIDFTNLDALTQALSADNFERIEVSGTQNIAGWYCEATKRDLKIDKLQILG